MRLFKIIYTNEFLRYHILEYKKRRTDKIKIKYEDIDKIFNKVKSYIQKINSYDNNNNEEKINKNSRSDSDEDIFSYKAPEPCINKNKNFKNYVKENISSSAENNNEDDNKKED